MKLNSNTLKRESPSIFARFFEGTFIEVAIDLGTANTRMYVRGTGVVINDPTVIAKMRRGGNIVAVGSFAQQMLGRAPQNIQIVKPLERGVISDYEMTQALMAHFLRQIRKQPKRGFFSLISKLVVGVPAGVTEVEQKAVVDAGLSAEARKVFVVEKPMAAAIGAGLPVDDAKANLILDVGGGVTEVAVIASQGIVASRSLPVAGDELDQAIVERMRDAHNVMIGKQTAQQLKHSVSLAQADNNEETISVRGRDLTTGLPKEIFVQRQEIAEALFTTMNQIVEVVRDIMEETPPELVADMVSQGLIVLGGGAKMRGFDQYLAKRLTIPVFIAEKPELAVIHGLAYILEHPDILMSLQVRRGK